MNAIRDYVEILNRRTLIVVSLSMLSTYLCIEFRVAVELPTTLIGIAIVFPIVFSINAAYRRREESLRYYASLKAHIVALYYAHGDWVPGEELDTHSDRMRNLALDLLQAVRTYFTAPHEIKANFKAVYVIFARYSRSMEELRKAGVSGSEVSRANQYLRSTIIEFERMRNIFIYRTPKSLRAYSRVFLNAFPILYAPYFADLSNKQHFILGFLVAGFYSLVLISLNNIQDLLENPYDEIGADDIDLNIIEDYKEILSKNME